MSNAIFRVSDPINEEVRSYLPHSEEIQKLMLTYRKMYAAQVDVPLYIGDKEVRTQKTLSIHPPHDHHHCLGKYHLASKGCHALFDPQGRGEYIRGRTNA